MTHIEIDVDTNTTVYVSEVPTKVLRPGDHYDIDVDGPMDISLRPFVPQAGVRITTKLEEVRSKHTIT